METSFLKNNVSLDILDFSKKSGVDERPKRLSTRNKTLFKETIKSLSRNNNFSKSEANSKRYPLSSDRNKEIT